MSSPLYSDAVSFADLDVLLRERQSLVVCTVVRAQGSVPRKAGARLAVLPDGMTRGTVGGGLFEAKIVADALELLTLKRSETRSYDFRPEGTSPDAFGAVCGGQADVFFDVHTPRARLVIVGGGHCGRALARMAVLLGDIAVVLLDPRAALAAPGSDDLPASVQVAQTADDFSDLPSWLDANTYLVLVSQGFATDRDALRCALLSPAAAAYIGMMGSRKKVRMVRDALLAEGLPAPALDRVCAPIGLEIGAQTPAEIAVSILAQVIAARAGVAASG